MPELMNTLLPEIGLLNEIWFPAIGDVSESVKSHCAS
jgi:hypothetical protein